MDLKSYIRNIPDYPKPGIQFKDITTLLFDGKALKESVERLSSWAIDKGAHIIVSPEARGFIFGTAVAYELGIGFVPVRKPGKLPGETRQMDYELEYGTDSLQIHLDGLKEGQKVILIDDLLATGGTMYHTAKLVESLGAQVLGIGFLIELTDLNGRDKLNEYEIFSIVQYD